MKKKCVEVRTHGADGTDSGHRGKGGCGLKISEGVGNVVEKAVWGRSTLGGYGGTKEALGYLAADRTSVSRGGYTGVGADVFSRVDLRNCVQAFLKYGRF